MLKDLINFLVWTIGISSFLFLILWIFLSWLLGIRPDMAPVR